MPTPNEDVRVVNAIRPDYMLLLLGITLLIIPLIFVLIDPSAYDKAGLYLRIIAALGAGLVGGALPGFLHINLPFAKAGGTIAIFLLVYAVDPPKQSADSVSEGAIFHASMSPSKANTTTDAKLTTPLSQQPAKANTMPARAPAPSARQPSLRIQKPALSAKNKPSNTQILVGKSPVTKSKRQNIVSKSWQTILPTTWVKPSDWVGRHFFLTIESNLYVWPVEIDEKANKAQFIINTNHGSRSAGEAIINKEWLDIGKRLEFTHHQANYALTLVDIRQAGSLPTNATFVKVDKLATK